MVDYEVVLARKERYQEKQRTIYVGNLNFRMEDWQLEDYFVQYGQVNKVHLSKDDTGRSKGFAHIVFVDSIDSITSIIENDMSKSL